MQAWTYTPKGSYRDVLKLTTIAVPQAPTGNSVLVKVAYSSPNGGDLKLMKIIPQFLRENHSRPGIDYSGIIVARGPTAPADLRIGDKVFGMLRRTPYVQGRGSLCEYISVDPKGDMVAHVPTNIPLEEASALASTGVVAFLICKHGLIPPGNNYRVLVNGASGGYGSMFVQGVLAQGAREVVGTCSAANAELVRGLGASKVIDYQANAPLHQYLATEYGQPDQQFDFILDTVGSQALYINSPKYLKKGGVFVNIGDYTDGMFWTIFYTIMNHVRPTWLGGTPRKFVMFSGDTDPKVSSSGIEWSLSCLYYLWKPK